MDYDTTVGVIKSCIVSVKGGLPINALAADFKNITGEALHPGRLGFKTLQDLLISIKEIYLKGNLLIVKDKKTDHLTNLISKQKGQTKIKAVKKTYYSNPSSGLRSGYAVTMRKGPAKSLREQMKKIEEINKMGSMLPVSNMEAKPAFVAKTREDDDPSISANYQRECNLSESNLSLSSGSLTSATGGLLPEERSSSVPSVGRGRGRARSTAPSVEPPGGLSESAYASRETFSPDIRSGVTGTFSTSSLSETSDDREPILLKCQMIGEGLMNTVASLILGFKKEAVESKLCCASLDIATCLKKLKRTAVASDKVMLMLGLTDIMKGKDLDTIKPIFLELLDYLSSHAKQILVLTLPVPICIQKMPKPRKTLLSYNEWLLSLKLPKICVIDLGPYTQNKDKETLDFLCEKSKLDSWNEAACWVFIEALFFSGVQINV